MMQQMLEMLKAVLRTAERTERGDVQLTGAAARALIECGLMRPDDSYNWSPEMGTLVELAERHPGLRLIIEDSPDFASAADTEPEDMISDADPLLFTTVQGTMSPQGFIEDAFPIIRSADDVTAELTPEGDVRIYAWWD